MNCKTKFKHEIFLFILVFTIFFCSIRVKSTTYTATTKTDCREVIESNLICYEDYCMDYDIYENDTIYCVNRGSYCRNNTLTKEQCDKILYSGVMYAQNSTGQWVNPSDVLSISKYQDDITFTYNGINGEKSITFESGVIYNNNYFSMADVKGLYPEIEFYFPHWKTDTYRKYAVNISSIPSAVQPNIDYITLTYKSHDGFDISKLKNVGIKYKINDVFELLFDDLIEHDFTVEINVSDRRIYIGNLTDKFVDDGLWLDPTIQLSNETTQNLEDVSIYQEVAFDPFYAISIIKFANSLSPVDTITDSTFCLFNDNKAGDGDVNLYGLNNQSWSEDDNVEHLYTLKDFTINKTVYSNIGFGNTTDDWVCVNVTSIIMQQHSQNFENLSIMFEDPDANSTTGGIDTKYDSTHFYFGTTSSLIFFSKEQSTNTSLRPYLNITYLDLDNITISDCNTLDEENGIYYLTSDITDSPTSNCMDIAANNVTLDCQGHTIDGNDDADYGIKISEYHNVTIKNCLITDWDVAGITVYNGNDITFKNLNVSSNEDIGFFVFQANTTIFINITVNENGDEGIFIDYGSGYLLENITAKHNGQDNIAIVIINNSVLRNIETSGSSESGIRLNNAHNINFSNIKSYNNSMYGFDFGINSGFINISSSNFTNNGYFDIFSQVTEEYCNDTVLDNVLGTDYQEILFYNSEIVIDSWNDNFTSIILCNADNSIINNVNLTGNKSNGIILLDTDNVNLTNLYLNKSYNSLYIKNDNSVRIENTTIENSENYGIYFRSDGYINNVNISKSGYGLFFNTDDGANVSNCEIFNNSYGITLNSGNDDNIFFNNKLYDNDIGIYIDDSNSDNNILFNNIFNNTENLKFDSYQNQYWNKTNQLGTNIYDTNNPYIGGNYWSDMSGTGFSENCTDREGDGFCDSWYNVSANALTLIYGDNVDFYPLSDEWDSIPPTYSNNITYITNYSGYCHQEFANSSESCGNYGNYSYGGWFGSGSRVITDGSYNPSTCAIISLGTAFLEVTLEKPKNAVLYDTKWNINAMILGGVVAFDENISINEEDCWNQDFLRLYVNITDINPAPIWAWCYDGSNWKLLYNTTVNSDAGCLREESIYWNIKKLYHGGTVDLNLSLSDDYVLHSYILAHNASGTYANQSIISVNASTNNISAVVNITNLYRGERFAWQIWFNDSNGNVNVSDIYYYFIDNTKPSISSPLLNGTEIKTNDVLTCVNGSYLDIDSDIIESWHYRWYNNNLTIPNQISSTLALSTSGLDETDVITCEIAGNDGYDNSTWTNSTNIATIFNSEPSITLITEISDPIQESSTQTITPTGQDDVDIENLYIYCCQDTTNTCIPTSADVCNNNQAWVSPYATMTCTLTTADVDNMTTYFSRCRLYDGTNYSVSTLTINYTVFECDANSDCNDNQFCNESQQCEVDKSHGSLCSFADLYLDADGLNNICIDGECNAGYCNNNSIVNQVNITSSSFNNKSNETLSCNFSYIDYNSDTMILSEVFWYNNTLHFENLDNTTYIPFNYTKKNENWTCSIHIYDGYNWSDWVNSSSMLILNTPPTSPTLLYPSDFGAISHDNIMLSFISTDFDNWTDNIYYWIYNSSVDGNFSLLYYNDINTTYNWTGLVNDDYYWKVMASDNEENVTNSSVYKFTVSITSPAITLDYPTNNKYFNTRNISYFNFTATDANGISECILYNNYNGTWLKNVTAIEPTSGNKFNWNYSLLWGDESSYLWNVWCNDTINNGDMASSNYTFIIDTVKPEVNISSPINDNTYYSYNINLEHSESDYTLYQCKYTYLIGGAESSNITVACNTNNLITFSTYGDYTLRYYAIDRANNINLTTIDFTLASSPSPIPEYPSGGGGGVTEPGKITCNITFQPSNITFYSDDYVLRAFITNNEDFSVSPIYEFEYGSYTIKTPPYVLPGQEKGEIIVSKQIERNISAQNDTLILSSIECKDFSIPIYYENEKRVLNLYDMIILLKNRIVDILLSEIKLFSLYLPFYYFTLFSILLVTLLILFVKKVKIKTKIVVGLLLLFIINMMLVFTIAPEHLSVEQKEKFFINNHISKLKNDYNSTIQMYNTNVYNTNVRDYDIQIPVYIISILIFILAMIILYILKKLVWWGILILGAGISVIISIFLYYYLSGILLYYILILAFFIVLLVYLFSKKNDKTVKKGRKKWLIMGILGVILVSFLAYSIINSSSFLA